MIYIQYLVYFLLKPDHNHWTIFFLLKSDLLDIKTFIEHNAEQLSSRGLTIDVGRVDDVMCEAGLEKLKADFQELGVTVECKSADIKSSKLCFDKGWLF